MSSNQLPAKQAQVSSDVFGLLGAATDYAIDAAQRTVSLVDRSAALRTAHARAA